MRQMKYHVLDLEISPIAKQETEEEYFVFLPLL
jgi:hypothetical protein